MPVVYTAPSISIAILETAAPINDAGLPLNRFLLELDIPDAVWALHEVLDVVKLGATRSTIPADHKSVGVGSSWLTSLRSPILLVLSVVVPEESAALINPRHPASTQITIRVLRAFEFNRLFKK